MPAPAKKMPRNQKIQPLDWKEASQSPALKGMVSFLDITPEEIRRGQNFPADVPSPVYKPISMDDMSTGYDTSGVVIPSTVDIQSPIDEMPTVDYMSPIGESLSEVVKSTEDASSSVDEVSTGRIVPIRPMPGMVVGEVPTLNRKIIRCRLAQDAHTAAEERLYDVLWADTTPADRTVRIGYAELAARTRLSRKTVGRLLQSLKAKLAIETLDEHRSMDLVPKNYRVYSYKEILDRRREAGMEYVIRMNGIVFVTADGVPLDKPDREGKQGREVTARPDDNPSPVDTSSTGDIRLIAEELNRFWTVDESATVQLLRSCREIRSDASTDEIAFFVREKVALAHGNRSITNPSGFVIATVPQCFAGETFLRFRARRNESLRIAAEEKERQEKESRELNEWFRNQAEAVLADPSSSEAKRRQAQQDLRSLR